MRILVVDDDYVSRTKLMALLSVYGQCDGVFNGEIAVKYFEAAHKELVPYDLVTMDIEMPVMDGQQTIAVIRAIEKTLGISNQKAVKILMVTVKKSPKDVVKAYYEGCDGYLAKPTKPEDIKKSLGELGFQCCPLKFYKGAPGGLIT
jgi:two-component system chemotaxis response regulator CheY